MSRTCGCQAGDPCRCRTLSVAAYQSVQAASWQGWPVLAKPARRAPAWCPT